MSRTVTVAGLALVVVGTIAARSILISTSGRISAAPEPQAPQDLGTVRSVRSVPDTAVEIAPSVFELGQDRVRFTWVTRAPSIGRVVLQTGAEPIEIAESGPTRYHDVVVEGLRPGTHYAYTIDGRFTAAFDTPRADGRFRFVVFGHPGGTHSPAAYPFTALASRLDGLDPAFGLCTGDLCYYSSDASFEELYFDVFEHFLARRPIYVAPGNHEAGFPTSEGIDFDVFRRLFPYDFGAEDYAYHSFVQGNIEFFACSYGPARPGKFESQVEWLKRGLTQSRSEFRIVYLGGAQNPMGFDRELLFRTAKEGGADFAFGGDGLGSRISDEQGLDFFFAGTRAQEPHDFFMVQTEPYRLEITQYDAAMSGLKGSWIFETQRPKEDVLDLRPLGRKGRAPGAALYGPLSLPSTDLHGIRVVVHNPFDRRAPVWLRWAPDRLVRPKNDYHYRFEARIVDPGATETFHYHLPAALPIGGEVWTLGEVEVRIGTPAQADESFDATEHVVSLTAFVDPLAD